MTAWRCRCGRPLEIRHLTPDERLFITDRWREELAAFGAIHGPPQVFERWICPRRRWWRWWHDDKLELFIGPLVDQRWL